MSTAKASKKKEQEGFAQVHTLDKGDSLPLNINTDTPGAMTIVAPLGRVEQVDATLVGSRSEESKLAIANLLEKASALVANFTRQAEDSLAATESAMVALMDGSLSIDQLASDYGEMSYSEKEAAKAQLARVMNSIEAQVEKTLVERAGIRLKKEQTLTVLTGLKAAFELQAETEKVADARDEAAYQGDKRDQKNVSRTQDINFRAEMNALDAADKSDRVEHTEKMNALGAEFRAAIRTGYQATVELKKTQVAIKNAAMQRIMESVKQKQGGKK